MDRTYKVVVFSENNDVGFDNPIGERTFVGTRYLEENIDDLGCQLIDMICSYEDKVRQRARTVVSGEVKPYQIHLVKLYGKGHDLKATVKHVDGQFRIKIWRYQADPSTLMVEFQPNDGKTKAQYRDICSDDDVFRSEAARLCEELRGLPVEPVEEPMRLAGFFNRQCRDPRLEV